MIWGIREGYWQDWQDSNLRYTGSKPDALPLGHSPIISLSLKTGAYYPRITAGFKYFLQKNFSFTRGISLPAGKKRLSA